MQIHAPNLFSFFLLWIIANELDKKNLSFLINSNNASVITRPLIIHACIQGIIRLPSQFSDQKQRSTGTETSF